MTMAQGDYLPGTYSRVGTEETQAHTLEEVRAVLHKQCRQR